MSPKIPRKPPLPPTPKPEANPTPPRPITGEPPIHRLPGFPAGQDPAPTVTPRTTTENAPAPAFVIHPMPVPGFSRRAGDDSLDNYWLREDFVRGMQPADEEGFRWIVGRRFVDVEHEGGLQTTHVDLDPIGVYRSKLLTERVPSGPLLYKNRDRPTWRMTEHPVPSMPSTKRPAPPINDPSATAPVAKQPRLASLDKTAYKPSLRSPDSQGYYELVPAFGLKDEVAQFAFLNQHGNWVAVDAPAGGFGAQPAHLQHWTDFEIWRAYGIHGEDLVRFRADAQASGKRPQWVTPQVAENPYHELLHDTLRWLIPGASLSQREAFLQSYNLLPSQVSRLQLDMTTELKIPQWAQAHKHMTEDVANVQHLEQLSRAVVVELNLKRNARHDWYDPETSMTPQVREALVSKLGYRRNKYNCLYRDDVPALFRGDERGPFELADDAVMLPRYHHEPGATTHKPMSATFSLKEGKGYASEPDPEYLRFNRQTNKYPGREMDDSSSDSGSSDTESNTSSEWSEPASPIPWDHDRNYRSTRVKQKEMFLYVLDTRRLEVVPHEENMLFNSAARDTPPTWFPSDDYEGLISVSRSGLEADRIWLLNSALTKAVKVDHLKELAGASAERIEAATHEGHLNKFQYDLLIDQAEAAGKPVLRLSGNGNEFAWDITWPESQRSTTQDL